MYQIWNKKFRGLNIKDLLSLQVTLLVLNFHAFTGCGALCLWWLFILFWHLGPTVLDDEILCKPLRNLISVDKRSFESLYETH